MQLITESDVKWDEVPRVGLLDYVNSDFSEFDKIDPKYHDEDDDFRIGASNGFLMKMDFIFVDTYKFRQAAIHHETHKRYTFEDPGTREYKMFWREETKRRRFGVTYKCKLLKEDVAVYYHQDTTDEEKKALLHDLHITGDHYNYLNYSRINRTRNKEELAELREKGVISNAPKITAFPRFWDGDYWNYKVEQFSSLNGFNLVKGKARRKGYSFKAAADSANLINLIPSISVLHAAYKDRYLTGKGMLTYMTKLDLDWYELQTYWVRNYLSEDLREIETGYKLKTSNIGHGFRSKLISAPCERDESALMGKDAFKIKIEEAGKFPNLFSVIGVTLSTLESGDATSGTMSMFGTGGTKDANWEAFELYFFNPHLINALPLENVWSYDQRDKVCGYFHPQIMNYEPFIDIDGNSDLEGAFKRDYVNKKNKEGTLSTEEYILYVGQRANTPEEAFSQNESSMFVSTGLLDHYSYVKRNQDEIYYVDGMYVDEGTRSNFIPIKKLRELGLEFGPYITFYPHKATDNVSGCIRKFYEPHRVNGVIPDNLYRVTMDGIAVDKTKTKITHKHSLVSLTVRAIENTSFPHNNVVVARYIGRRDTMAETDKIALSLCKAYNAKILIETDRGETVKNFNLWQESRWLLTEPNIAWSVDAIKIPSKRVGMTLGSAKRKEAGLMMLYEWLYKIRGYNEEGEPIFQYQTITDIRGLSELIRHNAQGNFDTISDWILLAFDEKRVALTKNYTMGRNTEQQTERERYNTVSKSIFKRKYYEN